MMGGGTVGYGYPGVGGYQQAVVPFQQICVNGQALTPYQQQFVANRQAAQVASRQYYPVVEKYRYGYGSGPGQSSSTVI